MSVACTGALAPAPTSLVIWRATLPETQYLLISAAGSVQTASTRRARAQSRRESLASCRATGKPATGCVSPTWPSRSCHSLGRGAHSLCVDVRWCTLNAQFSNGCTIGCPECDGSSDHYGHGSAGTPMPSFIYTGPKPIPPWTAPAGTMVLDPTKPRPVPRSICGNRRRTNATICDPRLRTINVQAQCGSSDDIFYFSPWRAPGSAPVIDSWCVA